MTKPQQTSPGGDWLADMLSTPEKGLDQVKKYLEEHKEELNKLKESGNLEDLAANIYGIAEKGLKKDLEENGRTTEDEQAPYLAEFKKLWEEMEMDQKAEEILASPELAAMDAFIGKAENLPKLEELIRTAEPKAKWQQMLAGLLGIPGLEDLIGTDLSGLLESIGLGSVLPKDEDKKKKDEEGAKAKGEETTEESDEAETEEAEAVPESFTPGKTLVLGGSSFSMLKGDTNKQLRDKINATEVIAEESSNAAWGKEQIEAKSKDYFAGFENVVIGFGTKELEGETAAAGIWQNIRGIIAILREKNPKIKVILATVPSKNGEEDATKDKRTKLNGFMKHSKREGLTQGIIDLSTDEAGVIATATRKAQYGAKDLEVTS